ncbi:hypothetical protein ACFL2A_07465, partial [Thermodesulfobacteriota bacterium]
MSESENINRVKGLINGEGGNFFFLCNDVIHALCLYGVIDDLTVISYDAGALHESLVDDGVEIFTLNDADFSKLKTTNNLISHELVKQHLNDQSGQKRLIVFKNSRVVEECAKELKLDIMMSCSNIARGIENKVGFYDDLKNSSVRLVPGETAMVTKELTYDEISGKYGDNFVMQASKGFGGKNTFMVRSRDDFCEVKGAYLKRKMRLTKFIGGETVTVNGCATKLGTLVSQPFFQVTGVEAL